MAGMPAGIQNVEGQLPGPPAFRSSVMASQIFWYSGVSGGLPASGIQLFGLPGPRTHWPLKFGYFEESWALDGVANSAIANAAAYIKPRSRFLSMGILQVGRSAQAERIRLRAHVIGRRWPNSEPATTHDTPVSSRSGRAAI